MYREVVLSSVLVIAGAAGAAANSPQLQGSYGFTGSAVCLVAPGSSSTPAGFNNQTQQPLDGTSSYTRSFTVEGIRTFNGDGTGTVHGTAVAIIGRPTPGFPPSASSADFSFSFKYTLDGNGGWSSTMVPNSYLETITSGPRNGQAVTIDAIPEVVGMISQTAMTLTGAHVKPAVEVHTYYADATAAAAGTNPILVEPQICNRSRTFVSLPGGN